MWVLSVQDFGVYTGGVGIVKKYMMLIVVLTSLMLVPLGTAGSSVLEAYGGNGANPIVQVESAASSESGPQAETAGAGTLPFTGADLAIFVVVGMGLVAIGAGLRRLGRNES